VDREISEALGGGVGRTPDSFGHDDQRPRGQRMLIPFHTHDPGPCHAYEDNVQLLVHVLPDAPSRVETHQVGVEVPALF